MKLKDIINETSEILDESASDIISAATMVAILVGGIGVIMHDAKKEKEVKERNKKEAERKRAETERVNEEVKTYVEKIKGSTQEIDIKTDMDLINYIIKDIKKCIALAKSDAKIQAQIKKSINKCIEEYVEYELSKEGYDSIETAPKDLVSKLMKKYKAELGQYKLTVSEYDYDGVEVIDAAQETRIALCWLLNNIVTALKHKWSSLLTEYKVTLGTGDGDEGCITIRRNKK